MFSSRAHDFFQLQHAGSISLRRCKSGTQNDRASRSSSFVFHSDLSIRFFFWGISTVLPRRIMIFGLSRTIWKSRKYLQYSISFILGFWFSGKWNSAHIIEYLLQQLNKLLSFNLNKCLLKFFIENIFIFRL